MNPELSAEEPKPLWQDPFEVEFHESDARGRLDVAALANRMQVTAWRHFWHIDERRGPLLAPGHAWIMLRMELQFHRAARCREHVVLETWPRGLEGIMAQREFRLLSASGESLMNAATSWVVMDTATGRIPRLRDQAAKWPTLPERTFIGKIAEKLPASEALSFDSPRRVGYRALDANGHVNHVRYLDWVLDALPARRMGEDEVSRFEINFFDEARCDDEIEVGSTAGEGGISSHQVRRRGDGKELCRARVAFRGS